MDRDALVSRAEAAGIEGARRLTKPELVDELLKREGTPEARRSRGLLGLARDLVARLIERGLHLPDAAKGLRGSRPPAEPVRAAAPVPTVTLAEIYAAQGHRERAVATLRAVLERDPANPTAEALLAQLEDSKFPLPEPIAPEADEPLGSSDTGEKADDVSEPASMLDADQPLPERYDVDECVAMPVDPTTLYVYWEMREDTLALLRKKFGDGTIALHVLVITPTWDGPKSRAWDIDVHGALGDWFVRDLPTGAVVRVAVGWRGPQGFVPAAHTYAVEPTPETRSPIAADLLAVWSPWGTEPVAASVEHAVDVARTLAVQEVRKHAIGAMAREAAAALGLRRRGVGPAGAEGYWVEEEAPLGSSELRRRRFVPAGPAAEVGPLGASERSLGSSELRS